VAEIPIETALSVRRTTMFPNCLVPLIKEHRRTLTQLTATALWTLAVTEKTTHTHTDLVDRSSERIRFLWLRLLEGDFTVQNFERSQIL